MISVLYYPFNKSSIKGHAIEVCSGIKSEILAIAVNPDFERQGIGRKLIQAFEKEMLHWDNKGYYRVATKIPDIRSNSFYRKAGFLPCHQLKHNDLILQIYLKEI
jgi:GNAT superfamily N-acetyltransferase